MKNISLIVPTIGRHDCIYKLLKSVSDSQLTAGLMINLYLLNQNEGVDFDYYPYEKKFLKVRDIKSEKKGLSINRNLGVSHSQCPIFFAFPDDDCTYYPDTISKVVDFFENNPGVDVVVGRIFDRNKKANIIKNWPSEEKTVNKLNFYSLSSSITIFIRGKVRPDFDINLGAGSYFGSCEDPDLLYRLLCDGYKIVYSPTIEVWHPEPDPSNIDLNKVFSYASGLGYFLRKDVDFVKLLLLLACVLKKTMQFIFHKKTYPKSYFNVFSKGLVYGLLKKLKIKNQEE